MYALIHCDESVAPACHRAAPSRLNISVYTTADHVDDAIRGAETVCQTEIDDWRPFPWRPIKALGHNLQYHAESSVTLELRANILNTKHHHYYRFIILVIVIQLESLVYSAVIVL